MQEVSDQDYTSIIPTAYLTAYPRTFTDIPYAKDIFEQLVKLRKSEQLPDIDQSLTVPRLAPEIEARYKLVDKLLAKSGINQTLELAAGLSTRGLTLAAAPTVKYTELELPDMAKLKLKLLKSLTALPHNLQIVPGNAMRLDDIERAVTAFDSSKSIAVINEGLLRYLNFSEKTRVAQNVHSILERFGGLWITCDTTPRKFLDTQDSITKPGLNTDIKTITGKNYDNNMFNDNEHVTRFFSELGFNVEFHAFSEIVPELVSPNVLGVSTEEVTKLLGAGQVSVIRLR